MLLQSFLMDRVIRPIALFAIISAMLGCAIDEGNVDPFTVTADDKAADTAFDQSAAGGKADGGLTYKAVATLVKNAGVKCDGQRIAIAVAVARAESGFKATATNAAGNSHGVDRGLWQINSYYQPQVSEACAFSPSCNARAMASISSHGTNFRPWWTFVNNKHLVYMNQALAAQAVICP